MTDTATPAAIPAARSGHRTIRVLSIDGGGIRGVIPATVLTEIERRTGRRIADLFDLVAGTSTGGILTLGLTKPGADGRPAYTAADLLGLYESEGRTIFRRSLWHRIGSLEGLVEERYPADGIEDVLARYLGDALLGDALTNVLVTAYEIERRMPYFFKSHRAGEDPARNVPMAAAARATSAAPTYFEPARVDIPNSPDHLALVDGGVYANNPAMCAYVEARDLFRDSPDVLMVSLGTGELTRRIPLDEAQGWGLAMWARPLLGVVFDGVSDTVDYQLRLLCQKEAGVERYYRFQTELVEGSDDLDDASATNLRALKLRAEDLLRTHAREIDDLCAQLVALAART